MIENFLPIKNSFICNIMKMWQIKHYLYIGMNDKYAKYFA